VSFYGDGFVRVPVGQVSTSHTTLELHFRTCRPDALLFLVVGDSDYCAVTLHAGVVVLRTDLGAGETVVTVSRTDDDGSFADLRWHYINATWSHGRVLLSVDRVYAQSQHAPGPFTQLDVAGHVFLGGTSSSSQEYLYTGDVPAFRGCMHHTVFHGVDPLHLAHDGAGSSDGVTWGTCSPQFDARSDEAISFVDEAAYVVFDAPELLPGGQISFDVRTRSSDAVVVYDFGRYVDSVAFLLLEIIDGRFKLRLGGERPVAVMSSVTVNDGQWHRVELDFTSGSVAIIVDGQRAGKTSELGDGWPVIEPASQLFVGGVSEEAWTYVLSRQLEFISDSTALSASVVGCVRNLAIGDTALSWPDVVASRHVRTGCVWTYPCQSEPCPHNSRCVEHGYDQYNCHCVSQPCDVTSAPVTVQGPVRVMPLTVEEEGRRIVSTEHVDVLLDYVGAGIFNSQVVFTAERLPVHGVLFVADSRPARTNVLSFSTLDLQQGRVTYLHDGSETTTDRVDLELHFNVATTLTADVPTDFLRAYNVTLAIHIVPVNDRPTLKLPANNTLVVVMNTHVRLTASILRAVDADDPPENLRYVVDSTGQGQHSVLTFSIYLNFSRTMMINCFLIFHKMLHMFLRHFYLQTPNIPIIGETDDITSY